MVDIASVLKMKNIDLIYLKSLWRFSLKKICISCQPSQADLRIINQMQRLRVHLTETHILSL